MRSALTVVALVVTGLVLVPAPANAALVWTITEVTGPSQLIVTGGGTQTVGANCPSGKTPISASVNASAPDDIRRLREVFDFGSGAGASVRLVDYAGGNSVTTVSLTLRCVFVSNFGPSLTQASTYAPTNNLAEGNVSCPADYVVLTGSVTFSSSNGITVLTSGPTASRTVWEARGYSDAGASMTITARCVPAANMPNQQAYTHSDPVGWGAPASASCPTGLVPFIGGTVHVGGDAGAITIYPKATATGWTSTTLSLSTGSMQTTVICVPSGVPTVQMDTTTTYTNVGSASWSFSGSDPAAAGGYTMQLECAFFHEGTSIPHAPCTSPVNKTGLVEGQHIMSLRAVTSDGRISNQIQRTYWVDFTDPTIQFADGQDAVYDSTSPSVSLAIFDASPVLLPECWVDAGTPAPCDIPPASDYRGGRVATLAGVTEGAHVLYVRLTDKAGNVATYDHTFTVDTTNPTVMFADPSGVVRGTASPSFGVTVGDATPVGLLECWVDGAAPAACPGVSGTDLRGVHSIALSGLGDGGHSLNVRATDAAAHTATSQLQFVVDTAGPTVSMTQPSAPFTLAASTTAAWSGADAGTGVGGFEIRSRRAAHNGGFSAWSTPSSLPAATTSQGFASLAPGTTYCYSVRALDGAGNASSWGERCTAVPLDDRALKKSKGWKDATGKKFFQKTSVSTKTKGTKVSVKATTQRVALVAQTCPKCGKVQVSIGTTKLGRINLKASSTAVKTFLLPAFSLRSGKVTVKVLTQGKLVRVDALGLSAV